MLRCRLKHHVFILLLLVVCTSVKQLNERKQYFKKVLITYYHLGSSVAHFVRHLGLTPNTGTKRIDCDYLDPLKPPLKPTRIDALMALMINVCPSSASRLRPTDEPWA